MARLGESAAHRLLADKLATAAVLGPVGIPFPALRGLCRKGEVLRPLAEIDEGGDLFVKPRHGRGGGGTFSLTRTGGTWQMNGRSVTASALLDRLSRAAEQDDLLVQERLVAAPDLADLVVHGRPPVLRVVTARYPGAAPFLHSALLSMGVPSSHPAHFLRGAVYAAVDPATGQLADGLSLGEPGERMTTLPWNGAPLTGRPLVALDGAVSIALRAMAALPPLPVVHWDFIPAVSGPVLLEGNTSGNWILACLPGLFGLEACPLTPMLASWRAAPPTGHPRSA
ncbi:Sugar-transfer associated ATP-grasp [Ancylobacter rudongensis]|uniref:Sugar-transfer associated ATP-grasp n=2 Tax=Ancylobacter rudongensis TaxID=177413 RepID=A0A1G4RQD8_9HYPH|nr:Sugar-transfer associated ATP-grasp [Ancylobacter rudongensis]